MKAAAAETVLLAVLLALAGYVAWDTGPALGLSNSGWLRWITGFFPGFISVQAILLVAVLVVAYWALQALGHRQLSFWLMAGFAVLPHAVPIWGHNQLEWYELFGAQAELIGERCWPETPRSSSQAWPALSCCTASSACETWSGE